MNVRQLHTYIGLFIAPSVLFFALTGSWQLFNLHEAHGGYKPPAIVAMLSKVHKDQVFALEHEDAPPPGAAPAAADALEHHHDDQPRLGTVLLKWFVLAVAFGLMTSTGLGLWLGLTHVRHGRIGWFLLAAGAVIPVALLLI